MSKELRRVSDAKRLLYASERVIVSATVFILALVELVHLFR